MSYNQIKKLIEVYNTNPSDTLAKTIWEETRKSIWGNLFLLKIVGLLLKQKIS